jgi:hypothetical protein
MNWNASGCIQCPGVRRVYRVLVRHGPVTAIARSPTRDGYRRWETPRLMQL